MTKNELIKNLGTVARSGTTQFLELIGKTNDMNLIGQFGVGFYSAFLVANKVTVISKTNKEPDQHIWMSSADGKFTLAKDPRGATLGRGTKLILHLKEDAVEYVEQDKIKELVKKYSQFINYPIYLWVSKDVTKQVAEEDYNDEENAFEELTDDELDQLDDVEVENYKSTYDKQKEEKAAKQAEAEAKKEAGEEEDLSVSEETEMDDDEEDEDEEADEKEPKKRTITETVHEWELINDTKAIWLRPKSDIENEEYVDFYKGISKDNEGPLTYTHFTAEGDIEFKSILFVPQHAPYDMFENYYGAQGNMKLYVRRVMISDSFEDLMPRYLNFISGVVHSDDLPLNVSREQLQQLKMIKVMSKKLIRKALDMLRKLAEEEAEEEYEDEDDYEDYEDEEEEDDTTIEFEGDEETEETEEEEETGESSYEKFWKSFGKNIKLGVIEDTSNRSKLAKLLR